MTLEQIWNAKQFSFETLPAFKGIDEILTLLKTPVEDDGIFCDGDQLFKLTAGNLEVEAGYYYTDDHWASVYATVYQCINKETQAYTLLDRCAEPLEFYSEMTLAEIEEQLFDYLYEFEEDFIA